MIALGGVFLAVVFSRGSKRLSRRERRAGEGGTEEGKDRAAEREERQREERETEKRETEKRDRERERRETEREIERDRER